MAIPHPCALLHLSDGFFFTVSMSRGSNLQRFLSGRVELSSLSQPHIIQTLLGLSAQLRDSQVLCEPDVAKKSRHTWHLAHIRWTWSCVKACRLDLNQQQQPGPNVGQLLHIWATSGPRCATALANLTCYFWKIPVSSWDQIRDLSLARTKYSQ